MNRAIRGMGARGTHQKPLRRYGVARQGGGYGIVVQGGCIGGGGGWGRGG